MRWFRKGGLLFIAAAILAQAELADWLQHLDVASPLHALFFRPVLLPAGTVPSQAPPRETVAALTKRIQAEPANIELVRLRAREAEAALDFETAEQDWRALPSQVELADYYHRRLQPDREAAALADARAIPSPQSSALFERSIQLAERQALGEPAIIAIYRDWLSRAPANHELYARFFDYLLSVRRYSDAEALIQAQAQAFPDDRVFSTQSRARIEELRGSPAAALALYGREYQPLWPPELIKHYFDLLKRTGTLRAYLAKMKSQPPGIVPATGIFYYWQQQGNLEQARRVLVELRQQKTAWSIADHLTVAALFEGAHFYDDAANHLYSAFEAGRSDEQSAEEALGRLISLVFTAHDQPIRLGSGDLSYYSDIASIDPYPGTLNGILSLLFNSAYPKQRFAEQEEAATSYFHRARASEWLALYESRFPNGKRIANLRSQLLQAFAAHGENDAVIRGGHEFLVRFPAEKNRLSISLLIADAHARKGETDAELATYDAMLAELGRQANGVPLGTPVLASAEPERGRPPANANSPEYSRVLDRYITRLVTLGRVPDALAAYRREIDRNPNDPGHYERLAAFLTENNLTSDIEDVYRDAIGRFADPAWHHKLARWYLRQKQARQLEALTRDVVKVFTGSELEVFFRDVVGRDQVDARLYLQLNLYAHQRFPRDLVFVRNLLDAYTAKGTADPVAWEQLIRTHWYFDEGLRARFFEHLSRSGKLGIELAALRKSQGASRAAAQYIAEAHAWSAHFEEAAPWFKQTAEQFPSEKDLNRRTASVFRSLAAFDPKHAGTAVEIYERSRTSQPRDESLLVMAGEVHAESDRTKLARALWNRIPAIEPGNQEGYLTAATIFWDYYLFDDALAVIQQARTKLGDPALFAYQAGAIYENQRRYASAVDEYLKEATATPAASPSRARLLNLARRPEHRSIVEAATARLTSGNGLLLRVAVLETQDRRAEIEALLNASLKAGGADSTMAVVEQTAQRLGFEKIKQRALEVQIDATQDPVERARLRIALTRLFEKQGNLKAARKTIESLYKEQPRILGVVRAATDFYVRAKDTKRAVATLSRAASQANPAYKRSLTLEASRKATEANKVKQARKFLDPLLSAEPLAPDLVSAMADTYVRSGQDVELRKFYDAKLAAAKGDTAAGLRRSLIPVLNRAGDRAGALNQYVELIRSFPEDGAVLREASRFAVEHKLQGQLSGYFTKAAADAPKDFRWPLIAARLQVQFEDYTAAVQSFVRASAIRPDRTDLLMERATLEERLMRFDQAGNTYARLYELSYRDPQWMVKLSETHARRSNNAGAIKALRIAYLDGRSPRAKDLFAVAERLSDWGMTAEAKGFADQGIKALAQGDPDRFTFARLYVILATRLRMHATALPVAARLVEPANQGDLYAAAAEVVRVYFTPEEKAGFAKLLETVRSASVAESAGLADLAARWLQEDLLKSGESGRREILPRLIQLQQRRAQFGPLAAQIEAYWKTLPDDSESKNGLLELAAQQLRHSGDARQELRLLTLAHQRNGLSQQNNARYVELLSIAAPDRLVALATSGGSAELRSAAVSQGLIHGDADLTYRTIAARGSDRPPVWTHAYRALAGLYLGDLSPATGAAFRTVLGPSSVGEQLGAPIDRNRQLAGDLWFTYASNFSESLTSQKSAETSHYAPAIVERDASDGRAFLALANLQRERKNPDGALTNALAALQLDPGLSGAHRLAAEILARKQRPTEAIEHWRAALNLLGRQLDGSLPESFWNETESTLSSIGRRGVLTSLKTEADQLLTAYVRRNGEYRIEPILRGVIAASDDAAAGVRWFAAIVKSASDPIGLLGSLVESSILSAEQKALVFEELLASAAANVARSAGEAREGALASQSQWQLRWIDSLLRARQGSWAHAALASFPLEARRELRLQLTALEARTAAQTGTLDALLSRYSSQQDRPLLVEPLREAASALRAAGEARKLLQWVYTEELSQGNLAPSTFLGLAEVRLEEKDPAGALALLRRMTLVAGNDFETLEMAADLLGRFGQSNEALDMRDRLAKAVPWDRNAAVAIASARKDAGRLAALASDSQVEYGNRAAAALALNGLNGTTRSLGSRELDQIASGSLPAAGVEEPYFYHARLQAAAQTSDRTVKIRLLHGALQIKPDVHAPRISLFRALIADGRFASALAILEPIASTDRPNAFLADLALLNEERASIAREAAQASLKARDYPAALNFLRIAQQTAPSPSIQKELDALASQQALAAANALRRPVISEKLDPVNRVQTRLTSLPTPEARP